ncbi:hypothetical protein AAVH_20741 [Aphelenchoides avenae]|nr:hypothetical protein AAVH_20741 [Aphelenchus avenae]
MEEQLQIRVAPSEDVYDSPPDFDVSLHDGDFDAMLLRFQHAFVEDFHFVPAHEASDDYVLLDSIVNLLRPQAYNPAWHLRTGQRWVDLLKRESFLSNVKTLNFDDCHGDLPAPDFILSETRYPKYDVESEESDIVAWIDTFFDTFLRGECTNEKLESVGVTWEGDHYEEQKSRLPKLLSEPSLKDVRIPRDDFAAYHTAMTRPDYRVGQCDLYVLTSAKLKKRMDVFKWTAEVPEWRSTVHAMLCEVKDI